MVDEKLIEEIVRRILARLLAEAELPTTRGGTFAEPAPQPAGVNHTGRVLTEWDVLTAHRSGKRRIEFAKKTIVTPLAKDRARDLGVELIARD